jgi:hypothetical protein
MPLTEAKTKAPKALSDLQIRKQTVGDVHIPVFWYRQVRKPATVGIRIDKSESALLSRSKLINPNQLYLK